MLFTGTSFPAGWLAIMPDTTHRLICSELTRPERTASYSPVIGGALANLNPSSSPRHRESSLNLFLSHSLSLATWLLPNLFSVWVLLFGAFRLRGANFIEAPNQRASKSIIIIPQIPFLCLWWWTEYTSCTVTRFYYQQAVKAEEESQKTTVMLKPNPLIVLVPKV